VIVSARFQRAYDSVKPRYEALQKWCDEILGAVAEHHNGTFASRVKDCESLYAKVELGGFHKPFEEITDLYAATVALPTTLAIAELCDGLESDFLEVSRKTNRSDSPHEFVYDDLHLTLQLRDKPLLSDKGLLGLNFELQIKTLLQYAWTKATHETIYKPRIVLWQADRVGAEAKAALELVDSLLADISSAAKLQVVKENEQYDQLRAIIVLLEKSWAPENLPVDLRRYATIVANYLRLARLSPDDLAAKVETPNGKALAAAFSLSPAQAVLALLIKDMSDDQVKQFARRARKAEIRFLVTAELLALAPDTERLPNSRRMVIA